MKTSDTDSPLDAIREARARDGEWPTCTLDRLTAALEELLCPEQGAEPPSDVGAKVAALLRAYAAREESWRSYVHYREDTYSRNLIWRCDAFELLLLCWNENQESPIHDHAGEQCWMAVLDGELEEVHYREDERSGQGVGPLRPGRVAAFPAGGVAYIHDDIALHLIRPKPGTRGATLHLYSSPIDTCRTFCKSTGESVDVRVGYHSVRGVACADVDPAKIRAAWVD